MYNRKLYNFKYEINENLFENCKTLMHLNNK